MTRKTDQASRGRPRRATMVHVAQAAGVSQSTVSFVLNDRRDVVVAEATRERVLNAAAELGYRPNRTAQSLRLNQSFLVGIVTRGIVSGPYAGRIVAGIQKAVEETGQLCMLVDVDHPGEEDAAVASFLDQGVNAIVYASYIPMAVQASELVGQTRSVFVNCWPVQPAPGQASVLADEYGGGQSAAAAAFDLGHTDVAFLGGIEGEYACVERHRGFVDAARAARIDPGGLVQRYGNYEISSGYDLTLEVFTTKRRPTALVCGNDRMAVGALLALHVLGLEVPRDVSLVGYDDQPDMADQLRPRLTTVELPHFGMGRLAGELLAGGLEAPARSTVPCPVVWRDSLTRPAAG